MTLFIKFKTWYLHLLGSFNAKDSIYLLAILIFNMPIFRESTLLDNNM